VLVALDGDSRMSRVFFDPFEAGTAVRAWARRRRDSFP